MSEPGGGEFRQPPPKEKDAAVQQPRFVGFNPWATLGFTTPEDVTNATLDAIRKAHRRFSLENHPDHHHNDPDARDRFDDGSKAYAILTDTDKREAYEKGEYTDRSVGDYRYTSTPSDPERGQSRWNHDQASLRAYDESKRRDGSYSPPAGGAAAEDNGGYDLGGYDDAYGKQYWSESDGDPWGASGNSSPEPERGPATETERPWWKGFDTEYDKFDFDAPIDKTKHRGRNRTHRPPQKSQSATYKRIDQAASRKKQSDMDKAARELKRHGDYAAYREQYSQINHEYDRRFFQKAKYGPFREQAAANISRELETAVIDKLVSDGHDSVDPKIYSLPDGTYLRMTSYWQEGRMREDTTIIEHITGEKAADGYWYSSGIEVVREGGDNGQIWLRRIARPYNMDKLTPAQRFASLQLYFNVGFGPYTPVLTEGPIKNKELRDYMAMLQQAAPRKESALV